MLIVLRPFAGERNRERAKPDVSALLNARKTAVRGHRSVALCKVRRTQGEPR